MEVLLSLGVLVLFLLFIWMLFRFLMNIVDAVKRRSLRDTLINALIFIVAICFFFFVMDAAGGFSFVCHNLTPHS